MGNDIARRPSRRVKLDRGLRLESTRRAARRAPFACGATVQDTELYQRNRTGMANDPTHLAFRLPATSACDPVRFMFEHIRDEFRGAALGDARRSARLERIGAALSREPGRSFPEAMGPEGQLEALYRFLNNDAVKIGDVLEPHTRMTSSRCRSTNDVLVLHDTTSFEFAGKREGLGRLHAKASRQGFFLHASLAVTAARDPLGVLAAETWARQGQARGRANKRGIRRDPTRESLRWARGVQAA